MAKFIFANTEKRACTAKGKNALFHKWVTRKQVIEPSLMVGGHTGGQLEFTFGLVEYEDGRIEEVNPSLIVFVDGLVEDLFRELHLFDE